MKKIAIAASMAVAAASASAQTYGELGYTFVDYEETYQGRLYEASPKAIRGIFGYEINQNLAVEGMLGFSGGSGSVTIAGSSYDMSIKNMVGVYAKGKAQLTPQLEGFVRAGMARSKAEISGNGITVTGAETGFSYGLGMSYAIDKQVSLNIDYMSYLDKDAYQATGFTLGVGYKF